MIAFIFLVTLLLGCKFGISTSENVVVDKVSPSVTPSAGNASNNVSVTPTPAKVSASNVVCPDPAEPCHHTDKTFDEWELSFKLPAKLKPNSQYRSGAFYGVILKTYPMGDDCDGGEFITAAEDDRKREQQQQSGRKVFASYECPNMGAVNYEFDGRWDAKRESVVIGNFIAVYSGTSKDDAQRLYDSLKTKYPKAMLKEMNATYEVIEQ